MTTLTAIRDDPRKLIPSPILHRLYEWGPRRRRRWERWPGLVSVAAGNHAVLTFDDGPDEGTLEILSALDDVHARATFFVLGEQVDRHPQIVVEIAGRGHELAVHGYRHVRLDRLRPDEARREITATVRGLEALGCRPRWFRPPYGYPTPAAFECCSELGLTLVYWTSWGIDWEVRPGERIATHVGRGLADGAIVLLHDSARYAPRLDVRPTADAIRLIAAAASERGLELVSVGEAMKEA
jgi:peptidoglycan/xylan/chitin deacetylase (PgdA/CDA1 family)